MWITSKWRERVNHSKHVIYIRRVPETFYSDFFSKTSRNNRWEMGGFMDRMISLNWVANSLDLTKRVRIWYRKSYTCSNACVVQPSFMSMEVVTCLTMCINSIKNYENRKSFSMPSIRECNQQKLTPASLLSSFSIRWSAGPIKKHMYSNCTSVLSWPEFLSRCVYSKKVEKISKLE